MCECDFVFVGSLHCPHVHMKAIAPLRRDVSRHRKFINDIMSEVSNVLFHSL